ncbi:unnamed protein product, partial [Mesorhabditis spiculigera]
MEEVNGEVVNQGIGVKPSGSKMPEKAEALTGLYDDDDDVEAVEGMDALFLVRKNPEELEKYKMHLIECLRTDEGETIVEVGCPLDPKAPKGLDPKELEIAVETFQNLLLEIEAVPTKIVTRPAGTKSTEVYLVREKPSDVDFLELRVAVVGNVDAGKSTLLGVLTHSTLDDGRGLARTKLFRHKHEFESGRTSSVGNDILGFGVHGEVVNNPDPHNGHLDWVEITRNSSKVCTFIDLAGHEKYLKTTIFGMTGHVPDYTMLMIGANMGIIGTTKEHLSLALSLSVPVFIVVTKTDMCPPQILAETMRNIGRLVKSAGSKKMPVLVRNTNDVVHSAVNFPNKRVCPIFQVSNVNGTNLDLLTLFLNIVPVRRLRSEHDPAHFQIDDVYWVEGVGTVVSGTMLAGTVKVNDNLLLGPNSLGQFTPLAVKSIHRKRLPVTSVRSGQTASFALRKITKRDVRKGMVMVDPRVEPVASLQFEADILILHHPTTIKANYQAMLHIGSIRQTATLMHMTKEVLRTGERDRVTFQFIKFPEFIRPGTKMVFREGRTKAVGTIVKAIPQESAIAPKKKVTRDKRTNNNRSTGPKPPNGKPKTPTSTSASASSSKEN